MIVIKLCTAMTVTVMMGSVLCGIGSSDMLLSHLGAVGSACLCVSTVGAGEQGRTWCFCICCEDSRPDYFSVISRLYSW